MTIVNGFTTGNAAPIKEFRFLDDTEDIKKFPTNRQRDWLCPNQHSTSSLRRDGKTVSYLPSDEPAAFDGHALQGLLPEAVDIALILIRRVNGRPVYRYLSNGNHDCILQPWSSARSSLA